MTDQSNSDLIAEARELWEVEDFYPDQMIPRLVKALEAAEQRAEEAEREYRVMVDQYEGQCDLTSDLLDRYSGLAAVVEKVRAIIAETCCGEDTMCEHDDHVWADYYGEKVADINILLVSAPDDALREVKAAVWDEGFDAGSTHGIAYQAGDNDALPAFGVNPYRTREEQS